MVAATADSCDASTCELSQLTVVPQNGFHIAHCLKSHMSGNMRRTHVCFLSGIYQLRKLAAHG